MKLAQLIVTAVFAFLGGLTFQLLEGASTAQDKGEKKDITHMEALKVDSLQVKELRVYDANWKSYGGSWDNDGIVLFGEDTFASLAPESITLRCNEEGGPSFKVVVPNKKSTPLILLSGIDGKYCGKWTDTGIFLFSEDGEGASLGPTSIFLKSKGGPTFSAGVAQELGAWLRLSGTNGELGVSLSANTGKTSSSYVLLHDTDGAIRAAMRFNDREKPLITTYDGAGKVVEGIGGK